MLVRQRSGGGTSDDPPVVSPLTTNTMTQRGRRASLAPGGPRRQLSRRVTRRDSRRGRNRRRSSARPSISHITIREPTIERPDGSRRGKD